MDIVHTVVHWRQAEAERVGNIVASRRILLFRLPFDFLVLKELESHGRQIAQVHLDFTVLYLVTYSLGIKGFQKLVRIVAKPGYGPFRAGEGVAFLDDVLAGRM